MNSLCFAISTDQMTLLFYKTHLFKLGALREVVFVDSSNFELVKSFVVQSVFVQGTLGFPAIKLAKLEWSAVIHTSLNS